MHEIDNQSVATTADLGYEIHVQGQSVFLVNRRLWAFGYAIVVFLALLGIVVAGVVSMAGDAKPETRAAAPMAFLVFGVPTSIPIPILGVAWFRRRRRALDQMPNTLIIDREAKVLRDCRGVELANLEAVRANTSLDLMTRGMSRRVLLRWPGGRRVVFRTLRPARAQEAVEILVEMCGGASCSA